MSGDNRPRKHVNFWTEKAARRLLQVWELDLKNGKVVFIVD